MRRVAEPPARPEQTLLDVAERTGGAAAKVDAERARAVKMLAKSNGAAGRAALDSAVMDYRRGVNTLTDTTRSALMRAYDGQQRQQKRELSGPPPVVAAPRAPAFDPDVLTTAIVAAVTPMLKRNATALEAIQHALEADAARQTDRDDEDREQRRETRSQWRWTAVIGVLALVSGDWFFDGLTWLVRLLL